MCVIKRTQMFLIMGQRDSTRFVITPLCTLELLHYCWVRQKETVHLEPDALWVVVLITVKC